MEFSQEELFAEMERLCSKYGCRDIFEVVEKLENLLKY